jgi:hypothetical protein
MATIISLGALQTDVLMEDCDAFFQFLETPAGAPLKTQLMLSINSGIDLESPLVISKMNQLKTAGLISQATLDRREQVIRRHRVAPRSDAQTVRVG